VKQNRAETASVVFISSVAALKGQPSLIAYAASKGALISVTRTLAAELAREQIRVNCICPGLVETDMAAQTRALLPASNFDEIQRSYPLDFGRPEDVAHTAAFLLSDASRWTTGTVQVLDGGYLA
jgi:NAD(P)-dependent dehydrogenase (short-subunit alcohol dehydrogenase family)